MAHFLKPPGVAADGYDIDNKLAPGSIWRVRIPLGARRKVALWGGDGLKVRSNNPGVVPNEGNDAVRDAGLSGDLRLIDLFGRSEGTSLIDVRGADGNFWFSIQARIEPTASTIQFGGPINSTQDSGDALYENNPQGTLIRITVPVKRSAYLNLLGLPPVDLKVAANDPSVASCDTESSSGSARPIRITGLKTGNAIIEAKNGQGAVLAFVQLEVRPGIDFGSAQRATQGADYSNVDVDTLVADMNGPRAALGLLSKGYCRWLEIRPNGMLIDAIGPVPGKAVSMSYPKIVYESMLKRVIVVRQGWSIRTASGGIKDEFLEIWWRTADDTEHKGVLSWCRNSENGNQLAYAMMVAPAAGDSVLFQIMKDEMARAVVGAAIDAASARLTRSWKPGDGASRPVIPKLNVPRAVPLQRGRYAANPPLDTKLTELARDARATQAGISRERFESINIATARVRVNGKIEYLDAGNLPGKDFGASRGIDSEQWLIVQVQEWRKQGKNVVVEQLYSERIPCSDCQNKMDNEFKEASIYYTVPEMRGSRADALMRAYGLDPAQVK